MIAALRNLTNDPDRTALHRSLRVALVMPVLFAFGLQGLESPQFALLGAFGAFSTMAMADFMGPFRSRLVAYLVLMLVGCLLIVIGTVLSNSLWPAVAAMLVFGVTLQFAAVLGGQFMLGNSAAILIFVLCAMVPASNDFIPDRLGGWILACTGAAVATALLWPRNERRDLYQPLVEAIRALAAVARSIAAGDLPGSGIDHAKAVIDRVREVHSAFGFRPCGPAGQRRALLGLIDDLGQCWVFAGAVPAGSRMSAEDRRLADAVATTLDPRSRR